MFQFSLESLLLVVTLAACWLGLYLLSPIVGLMALALLLPALLRTAMRARVASLGGEPWRARDKVAGYFFSCAVVWVALSTGMMATIGTRLVLASLLGDPRIPSLLPFPSWPLVFEAMSAVAFIAAFVCMFYVLRPMPRRDIAGWPPG